MYFIGLFAVVVVELDELALIVVDVVVVLVEMAVLLVAAAGISALDEADFLNSLSLATNTVGVV